jgi:chromosome segregation ATPase
MKSAEAEIKTLSQELARLEKQKRSIDTDFTYTSKKIKSIKQKINSLSQAAFIRRIGKAQDKIKEFQDELSRLSTDDKVFVLGGNTNDVIFALNRLPNQFQKGKTTKTGLDTEKELKQIAALSEASPTVEKEIDGIIDKNFPEELNVLFAKGISEFTGKGRELAKIKIGLVKK